MNLSINVIKDWLGDSVDEFRYINGRMDIRTVKLFSKDHPCEKEYLYVGTTDNIFGDGGNRIACINRDDFLILNSTDLVDIFNRIQDAFTFYIKMYTEYMISLEHLTAQELLNLTTSMFPTPVIMVDSAQTFIAISKSEAEFQHGDDWQQALRNGSISDDYLSKFNIEHPEAYATNRLFHVDKKYFFTDGYCKHIFINGERRASLILKDPDRIYSRGQLDIFESYVDIVAKWIDIHSETDHTLETSSHFIGALKGNQNSIDAMSRQTRLFGWDPSDTKILFVLSPTNTDPLDLPSIRRLTSEVAGRYATVIDRRIAILVDSNKLNFKEFNNQLTDYMVQRNLYGAVSFTFIDMQYIGKAFDTTLATLDLNPTVSGALYHCQKSYMARVCRILNEQAANTLLHPAIPVLSDYDRKNKTDYLLTLFVYLKNERRHQSTSEELFIHRNTLFQRLQKIQTIYPLDLEDPLERFHIQLSYYYSQKYEL